MRTPWNVGRDRAAWWALGAVLAMVVGFVVYSFIGTFVFGVFLYYASRPVYVRVRRRIRQPSLAAGISLAVVALPAVLLLAYTVAIALQEFDRLADTANLGALEAYVSPYLDISSVPQTPDELLQDGGLDAIGGVVDSASLYLGVLGTALLHLFVMIALAFYLLRDDHRLSRWVRRRFADGDGVFETYAEAVDRNFHSIFFGNILNALLTGAIGAIVYNLLNVFAPAGLAVPYPSLIGLLAGAASLIPIVGMKLVYFPVAGYLAALALLSGEPRLVWFPGAFFALSFVVVDAIPDLVLRPYVSGRSLHTGMVMFAYIFGPLLFGWYGIFLGPMLLVLVVHFTRLVLPELLAGVPVQPAAVDPGAFSAASEEVDPAPPGDET